MWILTPLNEKKDIYFTKIFDQIYFDEFQNFCKYISSAKNLIVLQFFEIIMHNIVHKNNII